MAALPAQQGCSASTSQAGPPPQYILPILGGRRVPIAANTAAQQNHVSASYAASQHTQKVINTTSDAGPSADQYGQQQETNAGPLSGDYTHDVTFHEGASTDEQNMSRIPYQYSSDGCDGDDEDESEESEDDSEDAEDDDDEGNDRDDEDESDENEEPDVEMHLAEEDPRLAGLITTEEDPRLDGLTAKVRRVLVKYMKENRNRIMMRVDGKISATELMFGIAKGQAELTSGIKRARSKISEDDEVEESQNRRAKRTKGAGDAAGSSGQPLPWSQMQQNQGDPRLAYKAFGNFQPSSTGGPNRQGTLANSSRRLHTRPVGSAVQRLHADRLGRPAAKASQTKTPEFPCYPQTGGEEYIVNANYYTHIGEPQSHPSTHRQRQPGSERTSTALNPTIEDYAGDTPSHPQDNSPADYSSYDSGNESNPMKPARNDAHTAPRRAYQQPAASNVQDDPFLSGELYNGMLNGRPDAHHVGSMYTRSQQREIDEYYQRLRTPHPRVEPETNTTDDATPSPPLFMQAESRTVSMADLMNSHGRHRAGQGGGLTHSQLFQSAPGAPAHGGHATPATRVLTGAPQPAEESGDGLVVGDIAAWDTAWSAFVKSHDSTALLRAHYPDEYR